MKPNELCLMGGAAVILGVILAFTPLINVVLGWWLAPLLVLGGMASVVSGVLSALWGFLRLSLRYLVCVIFIEEEQDRPAFHHRILNAKFWQLLGGGRCPA